MFLSLVFVAISLAPPVRAESFSAWAARGAREEREKNDDAAQLSYSNALSSWKPSDGKRARAKTFCARAATRDRRGDVDGALADYTDCLAFDQKNAKAFHRRGQLRLDQGRVSLAIDDFYKAISFDLRFGAAYYDRARAYEKKGDAGFAREDYKRACELGVKNACTNAKGTAPATARPAATVASPRFSDCLAGLQRCADSGSAFSVCAAKSRACEKNPGRGCCPDACLREFKSRLDGGASEASAYRETFSPRASCSH